MAFKQLGASKCFGGVVRKLQHASSVLGCDMKLSVFQPPAADTAGAKTPVLYWLSGLTCTEENFVFKAGAQRAAAQHGITLVCPDTSPRGLGIPGEDDSYDFGSGASFYVNATTPAYKAYQMEDYVTKELPELIARDFAVDPQRTGIFGHSMGGHGALMLALRHPQLYRSVSAFSPICNPTRCPWGVKAFTGYLGDADRSAWNAYDATCLITDGKKPSSPIMIDQGDADDFYTQKQLLPEALVAAAKHVGDVAVNLRMQPGYDHSYYFISSFVDDHIAHHAKYLA